MLPIKTKTLMKPLKKSKEERRNKYASAMENTYCRVFVLYVVFSFVTNIFVKARVLYDRDEKRYNRDIFPSLKRPNVSAENKINGSVQEHNFIFTGVNYFKFLNTSSFSCGFCIACHNVF